MTGIEMMLKGMGIDVAQFKQFADEMKQGLALFQATQHDIYGHVKYTAALTEAIHRQVCGAGLSSDVHQQYADAGFISLEGEKN